MVDVEQREEPRSVHGQIWRPEDVTCPWLTAALRDKCIASDASVRDFSVEPVGTGQMGDSFRFQVELEPPGTSGPTSVVGKFTAADDQSRTTGITMRTAEVEVRFYQQVAPTLAARTPACYFADVDPQTARFVLLFEDLAPRTPGDQVAGCAVDEASVALEELAKVHAPRWADRSLDDLEWLNRRNESQMAVLASIYPALFAGFVDRYSDRLDESVLRVGESFFSRIAAYLGPSTGPLTVQHADYRIDNLLFGGPADSPVAIVDWQTVTLGPGASDVAYFMGGSISVEDRRRHEDDLLHHYVEALRSRGVSGFGFDDLWIGYRRHAYAGLMMAVGAAMMVARTDRGDEMFLAMANRAAQHVDDMESDALLED